MRLVSAEVLKLVRRRGLMIWSLLLTVGAVAGRRDHPRSPSTPRTPRTTAPAGGRTNLETTRSCSPRLGNVAAIIIGATAGTQDVATGVFRDLVVTGRPRATLFRVRVPGALLVFLPMLAAGFVLAIGVTYVFAGDQPTPPGVVRRALDRLRGRDHRRRRDPRDRPRGVRKLARRGRRADRLERDRLAPAARDRRARQRAQADRRRRLRALLAGDQRHDQIGMSGATALLVLIGWAACRDARRALVDPAHRRLTTATSRRGRSCGPARSSSAPRRCRRARCGPSRARSRGARCPAPSARSARRGGSRCPPC